MAKVALSRVGTKTRSGHAGQRMHDDRSQTPDYIVSTRSHRNTAPIPIPTTAEMVAECQSRRLDRYERGELRRKPSAIRSDGIVTISGLIAFSHEAQAEIEALPIEEQDRRYLETAKLISDRLGTTLAGLVVHRDEYAPHAHYYLHGYGLDGRPVSREMNRQTLSELQDITASTYADLGIVRGKTRYAREMDGEDPASFIHKTLRELHGDIPAEIKKALALRDQAVSQKDAALAERDHAAFEAERAKEEADTLRAEVEALREQEIKTARRLEATQTKLAQAKAEGVKLEGKVATLAEREHAYQQRLDQESAELDQSRAEIERLKGLLPEPKPVVYRKPIEERREMLPTRFSAPESVQVVTGQRRYRTPDLYYPADAADALAAQARRQAQISFEAAKEAVLREQAKRDAAEQAKRERERMRGWSAIAPELRPLDGDLAAGPFRTRYGVTVVERAEQVATPPQDATPRQIATTLYRAGLEAGWPRLVCDVPDDVAAEIAAMAAEDGRVDMIAFERNGNQHRQQQMLEDTRELLVPGGQIETDRREEAAEPHDIEDMTPEDKSGPTLC